MQGIWETREETNRGGISQNQGGKIEFGWGNRADGVSDVEIFGV